MDVINCINLEKREDRLLSFCNQMRIINAPFRLWYGVEEFLTPAQNISTAHKNIVRWAKENNLERVVICEDDIIMSNEKSYEYFLSKVPPVFHLYFSMLYAAEVKEGKILNGFSGLTMYMVHNSFYQEFLDIPDTQHLDRALGQQAWEKEYYVCEPYVCRQMPGYSNNQMRNMEYSSFEEKMTFYEG